MVLERLFGSRDPLETELKRAEEFFREHKGEKLEGLEDRSREFQEDIQDALEELEDFLAETEGYNDQKGRQLIEDVVDNIAGDRIDLVEDFEFHESPQELHQELESFIDDFQEMKQKEAAVLEEINLGKNFTRKLKPLQDTKKELERFLEEEYSLKETYEELKQRLEEITELKGEKEELEDKLSGISTEEKQEQLSDVEEELEEFMEEGSWKEYRNLEKEIELLEDQKEELLAGVGKSMSKMGRGLKKLVYRVENTDLDFGGNLQILKDIRDGNRDSILENPDEVEHSVAEAVNSLPDELLGRRQKQKFNRGAEKLEQLSDLKQEIDDLGNEIEDLRQSLEGHDAPGKKKQLEKRKEELKSEISKAENREKELEEKIEQKQQDIEKVREEVKNLLRESFEREIKFR